ncbi:2-amino-4-hydroxy-6-hydroxymethyldihydropteridine diphosphokinase [Segetibacter sp. 3557_3]|uniref:2-amino-4-hydroxy-6- hydroxymethyldihydropteridine diphosphokinase n=1 Tax=Segetibacter sp. 3557_3 TaxID=2547429 RepID=UPI001058D9B8|nr:2-amino-4-hydroxy-6-hydroxymethyldihydropteridine diphosphokinase [Segetibacter sp. 3557_3]TDH26536.1 2-amino-4-hydroxy-6-hydroxymethyldihydropteridine diphosphokinase [Segetibacter sp. 3557_3]
MARVYLLIGGNMGERELNLKAARTMIAGAVGEILSASAVYETEAWGITDQPLFLNQAILVESQYDPQHILENILSIETRIGRKRVQKFGPRTIDIDILFYDNLVLNSSSLTIPHPEMQNRRFALAPLYEIAASLQHPVLNKTIAQLFDECPDKLVVKRIN